MPLADHHWATATRRHPAAEVQRYGQDLRSLSQGRGTYEVEFDHYDQVPPNVEQKVIEDIKRAREAENV